MRDFKDKTAIYTFGGACFCCGGDAAVTVDDVFFLASEAQDTENNKQ